MSGPSSAPRGEHAPAPGVTWERVITRTETVVPDCPASTHGRCLGRDGCDIAEGVCIEDISAPPPTPTRETRRALARAARRKK